MPPRYVKSIRDELFYEYTKLMSRSVFGRKLNYGFISDRFKAFREGQINMSGSIREWQREQELPKACVFCGDLSNLQMDHLIPKSRGGADSADNVVWACGSCNASRGDKGVFVWLGLKKKDDLHRLVAGKYLKLLFELHTTERTLDVSVSEIGTLCERCKNGDACVKEGTVGELTCFCLESVF
jgi:hypothetical protein